MHIRQATVDDIDDIQQLLLELAEVLGKRSEIHGTREDLRRFGFGPQPRFEAMLAYDNEGVAVGLAVYFSEYSTWRGLPGVYVQDLYVKADLQGAGLGRRLLRAVKEKAASWGGRYLKLTVYGDNPQAIAFYQHLGFECREDELPLVLRF